MEKASIFPSHLARLQTNIYIHESNSTHFRNEVGMHDVAQEFLKSLHLCLYFYTNYYDIGFEVTGRVINVKDLSSRNYLKRDAFDWQE